MEFVTIPLHSKGLILLLIFCLRLNLFCFWFFSNAIFTENFIKAFIAKLYGNSQVIKD